MPPVLGPRPPSSRALWSWELAKGTARSPSASAMKLSSSPLSRSSTMMRRPAAPNFPADNMALAASRASPGASATTTPLPAARPSALTTQAPSLESMCARAASSSVKLRASAVGMPCRCIKALAKCLEPSSAAAALEGPRQGKPAAVNSSTTPATRGPSGPTMVRETAFRLAKAINSAIASGARGMFSTLSSAIVPPLPGAT